MINLFPDGLKLWIGFGLGVVVGIILYDFYLVIKQEKR